jgi:hypothetical protein
MMRKGITAQEIAAQEITEQKITQQLLHHKVACNDCDGHYDYVDSSSLRPVERFFGGTLQLVSARQLVDEWASVEAALQQLPVNASQLHSMTQICKRASLKLNELYPGLVEHIKKLRSFLLEVEALNGNPREGQLERLGLFIHNKQDYILKELLGLTDMADKPEWEVPGSLFYPDMAYFAPGRDDWETHLGWSQHLNSGVGDWGWMVKGWMKGLCSGLEEVEHLQGPCSKHCSLGFRAAIERYRPKSSYSACKCRGDEGFLLGQGQRGTINVFHANRDAAAAAAVKTCKASYGLAKEAQGPLEDIRQYTYHMKCMLSRVWWPSFEGLVGRHLARKLASGLFRDYALWWRDEGEQVQGLLQDLEQMAEHMHGLGFTGWEGYECD